MSDRSVSLKTCAIIPYFRFSQEDDREVLTAMLNFHSDEKEICLMNVTLSYVCHIPCCLPAASPSSYFITNMKMENLITKLSKPALMTGWRTVIK